MERFVHSSRRSIDHDIVRLAALQANPSKFEGSLVRIEAHANSAQQQFAFATPLPVMSADYLPLSVGLVSAALAMFRRRGHVKVSAAGTIPSCRKWPPRHESIDR